MTFDRLLVPALAILAVASSLPAGAEAQRRGTPTQRARNVQDTSDMRSRLAEAVERVAVAERHGKISPARSAAVRSRLAQAQREMNALSREQGFVSAAELASYGRLVVEVDDELSAGASGRGYGEDGLPSAEVVAFRRADARLHYRDARIEYGTDGCAVYQGVTRGGKVARAPLLGPRGAPICTRR